MSDIKRINIKNFDSKLVELNNVAKNSLVLNTINKDVNNIGLIEEFDLSSINSHKLNLDIASKSVDSRKDGLNVKSSDFFNANDSEILKNFILDNNPGMTDEGAKLKLEELKKACSDYSIDHGCGAYSTLAVLNAKFDLNLSKENFFGHVLLNSLGVSRWYEIMNNKLENNSGGPINADEIAKVLDYYGYSYENLGEFKASEFDPDSLDYKGLDKKLLNHLEKGKPAILMVGRKNETMDDDYSKSTFDDSEVNNINEFGKKDGIDDTWASSSHYILLTGIDSNKIITIIDSRKFSDDDFSHIRYSDYDTLKTYISSSKEGGDRYSKYAGCILID